MPIDQKIIDKLKAKFGPTNAYPSFPLLDWRVAVCKNETRSGYWEWMLEQLRAELAKRQQQEVKS